MNTITDTLNTTISVIVVIVFLYLLLNDNSDKYKNLFDKKDDDNE